MKTKEIQMPKKKTKKTHKKGTPAQIRQARKEYVGAKRVYKAAGNKLGRLTGIKK